MYGLTCHAACYALLQSELGYKLLYSDVWPMLEAAAEAAAWCSAQGECLQDHYGGLSEYWGQVDYQLGCSLCTVQLVNM